jgi:RNA polymerase-binding transcription factor DksA
MNDEPRLQERKRALEERRREIQALIDGQDIKIPDGDLDNPDAGSLALIHAAMDSATAVQAQLEEELSSIEDAIQRIEGGAYGKCANCGQQIAYSRLEAVPYGALCDDCMNDKQR